MTIEVLCSSNKKDYKKLFNFYFHLSKTVFLYKLIGIAVFGIWLHLSIPYILKLINAIRFQTDSVRTISELVTFLLVNLIFFVPFIYYILNLYYLAFNRYWKTFFSPDKNFSFLKYTFFPHGFQVQYICNLQKTDSNLHKYDHAIFHFTKYGLIIDWNINKPGYAFWIVPKVFFQKDDYSKLQEWYFSSIGAS